MPDGQQPQQDQPQQGSGTLGEVGKYLGGVISRLDAKAGEERKRKEQDIDARIALYQQVVLAPPLPPGSTPDEIEADTRKRQIAAKEIDKLTGLKGDASYSGLAGLFSKLHQARHAKQRADAMGAPAQPPGQPQQGESPSGPQPSQDAQRPQETPASAGVPDPTAPVQRDLTRHAKGLGGMLRSLPQILPHSPLNLPPLNPEAFEGGVQGKIPTTSMTPHFGAFDVPGAALQAGGVQTDALGAPIDPKGTYRERDLGGRVSYVPSTAKPSNARPVRIAQVSVTNAKSEAAQGKRFVGADGQPIDLDRLPPGMGLAAIAMPGGGVYYEPFDPNQRVVEVGGEKYAVSPMEISSLPGGGGTDLGAGKVGSTSERDVITYDANGQPQINRLGSTRTPQITGGRGRAGLLGRQGTTGGALQPLAPNPTGGGSGASAPPAPNTDRSGRPLGLSGGMYGKQRERATPVLLAANQMFGDPDNPDFKGLVAYGTIMDNPQSVQRIGSAARYMLQDLSAVESKHGGLLGLIALYGGLPQAIAAAQSDATQDALAQLTPQEQQALNAEMDAYGTIIGLRSLTKGSASQYTAASLERELPIPGYNTYDAYTFYDKLSRLGEEVYTGAKGNPVITPQERQFYKSQYDRLIEARDMSKRVGGKSKQKSLPHPTQTAPQTKPTKDPLGIY